MKAMRKPNLIIWIAWTAHVLSWFLPVLRATDEHGLVRGWLATRLAACGVWPCQGIEFQTLQHAVLATISVLTTAFFLLCSPLVVLRGSAKGVRFAAWAAAAAFVFNTHWIIIFGPERSQLTIGYFLWLLSFLLLAIGLFVSSRVVVGGNEQLNAKASGTESETLGRSSGPHRTVAHIPR
jgi:hypothetical protein